MQGNWCNMENSMWIILSAEIIYVFEMNDIKGPLCSPWLCFSHSFENVSWNRMWSSEGGCGIVHVGLYVFLLHVCSRKQIPKALSLTQMLVSKWDIYINWKTKYIQSRRDKIIIYDMTLEDIKFDNIHPEEY